MNRYLFDAKIPVYCYVPLDGRNTAIEWAKKTRQRWVERKAFAYIDHVVGDGTYEVPDDVNVITYSVPERAFYVPLVVSALGECEETARDHAEQVWAGIVLDDHAYDVFEDYAPDMGCPCHPLIVAGYA